MLCMAQTEDDLQFVENKGQFEKQVLYRVQVNCGYVFLEKNAITFKLFKESEYQASHQHLHKENLPTNPVVHGHSFRYVFLNGEANPAVIGVKPFFQKHNYFLGNDRSKWASNVNLFSEVVYENIYPGIKLRVFSKFGQIKYEWLVSPGANPDLIRIKLQGLDSIEVKNNSLLLKTAIGIVSDQNLLVWQNSNDRKELHPKGISCVYRLDGNIISYQFHNGYNPDSELVIDPILVFSTYSGSRGDNFGFTATYDSRGNLYAGGATDNSQGEYPVSTGAFQINWAGGLGRDPVNLPSDITISKYDSSGKNLIYATYVGGSDDDYPHSMVVNRDSELVVFGTSYSKNFPVTPNAFDTTHNSYSSSDTLTDIVVFKLSKWGDQLLASTFFGGSSHDGLTDKDLKYNYADDFRGEVLTDKGDNIYVVSTTNSKDIPLKNAFQSTLGGTADGLCLKFSKNLDQLLWATYFGGNASDGIYSLEFDKDENIFVAGGTQSDNLPTHTSAINKNRNGGTDGFMASFDQQTFALTRATYYGTSTYDQIYFLEIDKLGNVYGTGQTTGEIVASNGAYSNKAKTGQFIFIADNTLSQVKRQTVFGARPHVPELSPSAFLVDSCGNIYLSGWGSNLGRPGTTNGLPITSNALQASTDGNDFYLAVFSKNLYGLLYATYYGGNQSEDHVDGGTSRFDKRGIIYQSVCSSCPNTPGNTLNDFPTSSNAAFPKNVSWRCSNAAFKIDFQINHLVEARFIPDAVACGPTDVQFTNLSQGKINSYWDFGDGNSSIEKHPKHSFPKVGQYKISLISTDSSTCNVSDSSSGIVNVLQRSEADFEMVKEECSNAVSFKNKSGHFETVLWNFGDSTFTESIDPDPHEFTKAGIYYVRLITDRLKQCPDTVIYPIEIKGIPVDQLVPSNVFTPDGDGINDCFQFDGGLNECSKIKISIYNRWGQKMFETRDMSECWNGKVNNGVKECPEGTYFYIAEYKGLSKKIKPLFSGTVTLIRK